MSEIEKIMFQKSDKWFFLQSFLLDETNNLIKIAIYPNDDSNNITSFLFKKIDNFNVYSETEEYKNQFPKQIIGIDYDFKRRLYVINCGEVEYSFMAKSFEQVIE